MKALFLTLLLAAQGAMAQFAIVDPTTPPRDYTPDQAMPANRIYVDPDSIPPARRGNTTVRLSHPYGTSPNYSADSFPSGSFRTTCHWVYFAYDDPIVYPRQKGPTHLHMFFGNDDRDVNIDLTALDTVGGTLCPGGILNRSKYWIPALVYHCPSSASGCTTSRNGEVQLPLSSNFYYKCAKGSSCDGIVWPPVGMKIITGHAANRASGFGGYASGRIECWHPTTGGSFDHIPSPAQADAAVSGCTAINILWPFPDCWDGVNTDSPGTHDSHVAYSDFYLGCNDPAYPQRIPEVAFNINFEFDSADLPYWRLTSDDPEVTSTLQSGSTTTAVVLNSSASSTDDYYTDGIIAISGEMRYITAYVGSTRTATLASALSGAPSAGTSYNLRNAAGRSLHGDWANGWSTDVDVFGTGIGSVRDVIIRNCYRGDSYAGSLPHGDCHDDHLGNPSDVDDLTPANMWGMF